jgi:hypothetical protein
MWYFYFSQQYKDLKLFSTAHEVQGVTILQGVVLWGESEAKV